MDPDRDTFKLMREGVAKKALPDRDQRARGLRNTARENADGSRSTVLFSSGEVDGKHVVVPTLFPKDVGNYGSDPKDWVEFSFPEALGEAKKRGEVFTFTTPGEADAFARGSWKMRKR
jgi:hypothetical protein|tara:strand:+ start:6576 stop:6929 length:354 start_codon:yes stop_codon:yes gene_type:complete